MMDEDHRNRTGWDRGMPQKDGLGAVNRPDRNGQPTSEQGDRDASSRQRSPLSGGGSSWSFTHQVDDDHQARNG